MLECGTCHAVWIDAATFEHICANQASQAAVLHQWTGASERGGGSGPPKQTEVRYRKCVACGTIMNRLNFGRLSGTIVDVCRGHGTFMDAGELHAIVRFMQSGGLDRARQRQIEDLKDQEQRLRQAQSMRADGEVRKEYSFSKLDLGAILDSLRRNSS
jgi:Zn-finger nucleic acid-binding protein